MRTRSAGFLKHAPNFRKAQYMNMVMDLRRELKALDTPETLTVYEQLTIRKEVLEIGIRDGLHRLSDELTDVIEQLCLLENITEEEQAAYFDPRTPEEAWKIFDEMAEIVTDLQKNPPEFGSAAWFEAIEPIEI